MTTYREAFPDFAPDTMPTIPSGFEDASWKNESCPSFYSAADDLTLWVDYADLSLREHEGTTRFALYHQRDGMVGNNRVDLYEGDDWSELLKRLQTFREPKGKRRVKFAFFDDQHPGPFVGFTDDSEWNGWPVVWIHTNVADAMVEMFSDDPDTVTSLVEAELDSEWLIKLEGFTPNLIPQSMAEMCAEFEAWRTAEGIDDEGDAMELMMYEHRTPDQMKWLSAFSARWEETARENPHFYKDLPPRTDPDEAEPEGFTEAESHGWRAFFYGWTLKLMEDDDERRGWQRAWSRAYALGWAGFMVDDLECPYPQFSGAWEAWGDGWNERAARENAA